MSNIGKAELEALAQALPRMGRREREETLKLLEEIERRRTTGAAKKNLLQFAKAVYPGYSVGAHHRWMSNIFKEVLEGKKRRVIINIAPRHGKSELTSYLLPSWWLGHKPESKIMMVTHTEDLSASFGRRIRNLIDTPEYSSVFPETAIAKDAKGSGSWATTKGGTYYAAGVGGAIAGRGADLLIIDDPHSEQSIRANPKLTFDSAWQWYQTGPRQRLQWGGSVIVVMCMTGDTSVRLADNSEKPLREVRPGDTVATYDNGTLSSAKVRNWQSSGVDSIFTVRTQSGRILRANERHPFLVEDAGERRWVRLRELKPGMCLVAAKDVRAQLERKQGQHPEGFAAHALQERLTTKSILTRLTTLRGITVSTKVRPANSTGALSQPRAEDCASRTTTSHVGLKGIGGCRIALQSAVTLASSIATESLRKVSTSFSRFREAFAQCAGNLLPSATLARTGTASCASITSTRLGTFADFSATTATLPLGTQRPQQLPKLSPDTSDFTTDKIVEILPAGREEVFDIEVERTGNFIANGVVSHNTRWGKLDLTGKLVDWAARNPDGDQWEVVEFPAIMPSGSPLWPEKWPLEELEKIRATIDPRYWQAQYMQQPTADEGALVKRNWWRQWDQPAPPVCEYVIQSWDTAHEAKTSADYSAYTCWGVFNRENEDGQKVPNVILLDAFKDRMEFPELKKVALKHFKDRRPDTVLIERKASGAPLIQELRAMGVPATEFTPSRGRAGVSNDKTARLNAVSDMFSSGMVWAPDTVWAKEVIEEVASFPAGEHDDYVDSTVQALMRIRAGGLVRLPSDDEDTDYTPRRAAYY